MQQARTRARSDGDRAQAIMVRMTAFPDWSVDANNVLAGKPMLEPSSSGRHVLQQTAVRDFQLLAHEMDIGAIDPESLQNRKRLLVTALRRITCPNSSREIADHYLPTPLAFEVQFLEDAKFVVLVCHQKDGMLRLSKHRNREN